MWELITLGRLNWAKEKGKRKKEKVRIIRCFITIIC